MSADGITTEGFESTPVYVLPVSSVEPDPNQPRKTFDPEALESLANSIKSLGQIQAIVVERIGPNRYRIEEGERRWRASKLAGLDTIRAEIIEPVDATTKAARQIVENLQREDLTSQETVAGCQALVNLAGLEEAARLTGKSKSWVSQRATLAGDIDKRVKALLDSGKLTDVEVAHIALQIIEIDGDEGKNFIERLQNINGWYGVVTREKARSQLKEAKAAVARKRQAEVEAAKRKKLEEENRARIAAMKESAKASAAAKAKGEKPAAAQLPLVPPPPKNESQWDRERRERAEAWVEREPEMKKLARESKKAIAEALQKTVGTAGRGFEFHVGMLDGYASYSPPAKAKSGDYRLEISGGTEDAGLVLDAMASDHEISLHVRLTIDELRELQRITGETYSFREVVRVKGAVVTAAADRIREIHIAGKVIAATNIAAKAAEPAIVPSFAGETPIGGILAWLSECVDSAPETTRTDASLLIASYAAWCKRNKRDAVIPNALSVTLQSCGYGQGRTKRGPFYTGLQLRQLTA